MSIAPLDTVNSAETVYRFATFGASGTISLGHDRVVVRRRCLAGWWEHSIPLEHLDPHYATLDARHDIYTFAWGCAGLSTLLGALVLVTSSMHLSGILCGLYLILVGVLFARYLYQHRKSEWIIFPVVYLGSCISYTRQGPDADRCDDFTRHLAQAIMSQRRLTSLAAPPREAGVVGDDHEPR